MKNVYLLIIFLGLISCEVILVEDISNESILLLAPSVNSEVPSGNISFSWQLVNEADSYNIQIASPNFENASQILLDSITSSISANKNLEVGEYQWRVKAINSEYETPFSTVSFTVN